VSHRQFLRGALSAFHVLAAAASSALKSRATLQLENLALRHQLGVLRRSVKRPKLTSADRLLWAWLSEVWNDWRSALVIVKPETVIAWHRKGFRLSGLGESVTANWADQRSRKTCAN
jgi:putative transposase